MFMRLYSSDIPFNDPDTDDTGHKYSTFIDCSSFNPAELLGGVSMPYTTNIEVSKAFTIVDEQTSLLARIYYANGETIDANIKLRAKK